MKKILLFSRDPGGANVIASLINPLKNKGYEIKLFGKDYALDKYKQFHHEGIDILNSLKIITLESVRRFLLVEEPDFIITGTSADDYTEKYMWECAKELGIPSFAILDQWMSYGIRFSEFTLAQIEEYNLKKTHKYLPTKILVMDEYAKNEIIKEGIEKSSVVVTGQPYFDYLINKKNMISNEEILNYKESINCSDSDIIITFATEAIIQTYSSENKAQKCVGYTDISILHEIYECIKSFSYKYDKSIKIVIRLHPKDEANNYSDFLILNDDKNIKFLIDKNTNPMLVIKASNAVCGMSSMFLIESAIIGKPILSIQIGLRGENPFVFNQTGQIKTILTTNELESVLNDFIINEHCSNYSLNFKEGSIEKIISLMEGYLC